MHEYEGRGKGGGSWGMDKRLHSHVVVNTLAHDRGGMDFLLNGILNNAFIFELVRLFLYGRLDLGVVSVVAVSLHKLGEIVMVLFGADLSILNGLHRAVIVVLVVLLNLGGMDLLFVLRLDHLVLHGRSRLWQEEDQYPAIPWTGV